MNDESGAAQLEVNFLHLDPMSRADQVFLFKRTMREAAMRHGIYATFLAKPMEWGELLTCVKRLLPSEERLAHDAEALRV